jgi:hypothetical protein
VKTSRTDLLNFSCGVVVDMVTPEQVRIIEQLVSDCADELDSDLYSDGAVVARKLYRLATAIRVSRRGRGVDIVEYVGGDPVWGVQRGGMIRHG